MAYYLAVHVDKSTPRESVEDRWTALELERRAIWLKTWYDFGLGKRYCWWDAPTKQALEEVFRDYGVPWEEIIEVEHTTPAEWVSRDD